MTKRINPEITAALRDVQKRISQGWTKLNDDGSKTCVGSPPGYDLYKAVIELGPGFPIDAVFDLLARRVVQSYPDRVRSGLNNPYDARVIVMEFNDDPGTSYADVLNALD